MPFSAPSPQLFDIHACTGRRCLRGWGVRDSTAKVISRFIGSDIYYRRVYFYCVPFSEFLVFPSLYPLLCPFSWRAPPSHYFPISLSFEYNLKGRFCQTSTLCPFGLRAPSVRRVADATVTASSLQTYVYKHTCMYIFARVVPRHRPS